MFILKGFVSFIMSFVMLFGMFSNTNNWDTYSGYVKNVESVNLYENTMDTAVPATKVYDLINEHFNSALPTGKTAKKCIVLGFDGARADLFSLLDTHTSSCIKTCISDGGHACISYCGGVNYPMFNVQATSTAPGWCSMLTGKWGAETGVTDNGIPKSNDNLTLLTTLIKNQKADSTAFYVSWGGHFSGDDSTYKPEKDYCAQNNYNVNFSKADDDEGTYKNAVTDINSEDCSDFIFTIFEYCDHYGHDTGFNLKNEDYVKGFTDNDKVCNDLITAIKARKTYSTEDWLIIITSDHGGYNTGHGSFSAQERYTFIVTNKTLDSVLAK